MAIYHRELPGHVKREWYVRMRMTNVNLQGRQGDLNCQRSRIRKLCHSLGIREECYIHILQPPATLDQKGWHRVTDTYASTGLLTLDVEGGVLPGVGHCLVIPTRGSHVVCVENLRSKRVGAVRVRSESLANQGGCGGPSNTIEALLNKLEVMDGSLVRVCITGGGPPESVLRIADILGRWGVHRNQTEFDGLIGSEPGLGNQSLEKPEQNWVFIHQVRQ